MLHAVRFPSVASFALEPAERQNVRGKENRINRSCVLEDFCGDPSFFDAIFGGMAGLFAMEREISAGIGGGRADLRRRFRPIP